MPPNTPPDGPFWFPEVLAAFALLDRAGFDPSDLYFAAVKDAGTGVEYLGIEVRPPAARGLPQRAAWTGRTFRWAVEPINYARTPNLITVGRVFADDMAAWNKLSQEAREQHMQASQARKSAVPIIAAIHAKLGPQP